MKATFPRSFPRRPQFLKPNLPSQENVAKSLRIILALLLTFTAVWAMFSSQSTITPTKPEGGLELILSGAITNTLSLGTNELETLQCSPTGFQVTSAQATTFPLAIGFNAPTSTNGSFYTLGSSSTLALNIDGAAYTLLSGTVTTAPGAYTFNASFVDAQSQPLQLSGRLSCP